MNSETTELTVATKGNGLAPTAAQRADMLAPRTIDEAIRLATAFAKAGMFAVQSPEQALTILMAGMELGLRPTQSMRAFSVIKGKPVLDASAMVAVCVAKRDICEYFTVIETTVTYATYETKRVGSHDPVRMSFTIDQAKNAGLLGKDNWRNFPDDMLRARASSKLARAVYPDLLLGIYTKDEIEGIPDATNAPAAHVDPNTPESAHIDADYRDEGTYSSDTRANVEAQMVAGPVVPSPEEILETHKIGECPYCQKPVAVRVVDGKRQGCNLDGSRHGRNKQTGVCPDTGWDEYLRKREAAEAERAITNTDEDDPFADNAVPSAFARGN